MHYLMVAFGYAMGLFNFYRFYQSLDPGKIVQWNRLVWSVVFFWVSGLLLSGLVQP